MDVAAGQFAPSTVEFFYQAANLRLFGGVGRSHDDGVAAALSQDGGFVAGVGLSLGCSGSAACVVVNQAHKQSSHIVGHRVLQGNHLYIGGIGHIQGSNDAPQALQVVGVVGDDQGVRAWRDIDGVVRADEGAQHRYQVVGVFMRELEDLRHHLGVVGCGARRHHRHLAALQLGLGFGHDFVQALRLNHGKALQTQHRQKLVPRHIRGHRFVGA